MSRIYRVEACVIPTIAIIFLISILVIPPVRGDGFRNPPHGPTGFGRLSGKAYGDDPSAIFHNPANLINIEHPSAVLAFTFLDAPVKYRSPAGRHETTQDHFITLPNLYAAWPTSTPEKWTIGLGVSTPFGQSTRWPKRGVFRYESPYFAGIELWNINPTVAFRLSNNLAAGFGVDVYPSSLTLRQYFDWSGAAAAPPGTFADGLMRFDADGTGYGVNLGLTWKIADGHQFGISYRSPFEVEYHGSFKISNNIAPGDVASRSNFETTIDYPAIIAAGYGIRLNDRLFIEFNAEWLKHSSFSALDLELGRNTNKVAPATIPQNWDNNWAFGFGVDWRLSDRLLTRFGYHFVESPIPNKTLLPTLTDPDRHVVAMGFEYRAVRHVLNLAYSLLIGEERDVNDNQRPAFEGRYRTTTNMIGLSYEYTY